MYDSSQTAPGDRYTSEHHSFGSLAGVATSESPFAALSLSYSNSVQATQSVPSAGCRHLENTTVRDSSAVQSSSFQRPTLLRHRPSAEGARRLLHSFSW